MSALVARSGSGFTTRSLPLPPPAAVEPRLAVVGGEPRHAGARRHVELLQHLAGGRVDPPQAALVVLPGAVPALVVDPGDAGDEAVGFDRAQDRAGRGIDLVDLAPAILADPQRALGPGQARVAVARRGDGGQHATALRIDLADAVLGDLEQVVAVERGAGVGGDVEGAQHLAVGRVTGVQPRAGGEPHMLAIAGDAMHAIDVRVRSVLDGDLGVCSFHVRTPRVGKTRAMLVKRQRRRE
ncbi:hypothetical protein [Rhodanobacter lindaniclasticus]